MERAKQKLMDENVSLCVVMLINTFLAIFLRRLVLEMFFIAPVAKNLSWVAPVLDRYPQSTNSGYNTFRLRPSHARSAKMLGL